MDGETRALLEELARLMRRTREIVDELTERNEGWNDEEDVAQGDGDGGGFVYPQRVLE